MKKIKKIICTLVGHSWVYKSPNNLSYKICNRCNKTIKDNITRIINKKLTLKELVEDIFQANKEDN